MRQAPAERPPAELLRCPAAPTGLPATVLGSLTPEARAAVIRLATYAGATANQLSRLITFHTDEACGDARP
ncbi:MAG: hypothetical protein ACT6TH_14605 [Brevundimonas sp.]|uniref:hypothetical protein n=1 Tax=Brevundimonas sp. TaxID=1871086 RepID=UPI0040331738